MDEVQIPNHFVQKVFKFYLYSPVASSAIDDRLWSSKMNFPYLHQVLVSVTPKGLP